MNASWMRNECRRARPWNEDPASRLIVPVTFTLFDPIRYHLQWISAQISLSPQDVPESNVILFDTVFCGCAKNRMPETTDDDDITDDDDDDDG